MIKSYNPKPLRMRLITKTYKNLFETLKFRSKRSYYTRLLGNI